MASRLTRDAESKVKVREECIKGVVAWPKGTRQRAVALDKMQSLTRLSKQRCYDLVAAYEAALAAGGDPRAVLRRKPRKDAGAPRAGGEQLRRDAAWLKGTGVQDLAEQQRSAAERAARELKLRFAEFCCDPQHCDLKTSMVRRLFEEAHPELALPHSATLRRWRAEIDPALTMTRREANREFSPRGRVEARHPNHLWLADQHVADLHVWHVDPETGESTPRRPTLFQFLDRFTGLPMGGFYSWSYSSETVAMCLWEAMLPDYERELPWSGLPEHLYWDRGEQHWSAWMQDTCRALKIETHKGEPYEWAPHGFIEGHHNIIHTQFESLLPGYCGSDGKTDQMPLAWRKFRNGEGPCPELLTLDELNERWHAWRRWLADQPYRDGRYTRQQLYDLHVGDRDAYPSWEAFPLAIMRQETRVPSDEGAVTVHGLTYEGWPLNELKGTRVPIAFLPGHMGHVWVLDSSGARVLGVVPVREVGIFGDDPALRAVGRRRRSAREGVKRVEEVKRGLDALVGRGEVDQAEAEQAAGVLTRLQAVARAETKTIEMVAAEVPDNVVELKPRRVAEEKPLRPGPDLTVVEEALAGGPAPDARPRLERGAGGLLDF